MVKIMTEYNSLIAKSCLKCIKAPCSAHCPLKMPIPLILELVSNNKEDEAADVLFNYSAFPFVCGALCDTFRKCSGHCVKKQKGECVLFNEVETYLGHKYLDKLFVKPKFSLNYKVALIGGGISNLTIALRLINNGIRPTIYEKTNHLGGVLTNSLPSFRYDKTAFLKVLDYITKNSNIYYNYEFGKNLLLDDLKEYEKIVIGTGSMLERSIFQDSEVYGAIKLLENENLRKKLISKKVIVLGGGNVAFDIARVLNKEGAIVSIAYRRDLDNAPASIDEIKNALNENIKIIEKVSPTRIIKIDGQINKLELEKMELYDSGDSRLNFRKTGEFLEVETDAIVEALGSFSDYTYLKKVNQSLFDENGWLIVDDTFKTKQSNLYATGDFLTGPKDFSSAIAIGEAISKNIINEAYTHPYLTNKEVVLGGSFNPPTLAHMEMMKVLNKFNPQKIILLPNGDRYKLCYQDKKLNNFDSRCDMLKELIIDSELTNCEISVIENEHHFMGTYYTLEQLNNPAFVLGSDCLFDFPKWHHFESLVKNNHFVVFTRESDYQKCFDFLKKTDYLKDNINHFTFINFDMADISSTKFKETLNKDILTKNVYRYIKKHNLYEVNSDE